MMNRKNLVGGIVLAGAAAAATAAVVAVRKRADSHAEDAILLELDGDDVTEVVLEDEETPEEEPAQVMEQETEIAPTEELDFSEIQPVEE